MFLSSVCDIRVFN